MSPHSLWLPIPHLIGTDGESGKIFKREKCNSSDVNRVNDLHLESVRSLFPIIILQRYFVD